MFNRMYEKLEAVNVIPMKQQMIELLQRTWTIVSESVCTRALKRKRPFESLNGSDIARVELLPDEARCAAYSNMNRWANTSISYVLEEWFDLELQEQNQLLIEAFPDGRVYGV